MIHAFPGRGRKPAILDLAGTVRGRARRAEQLAPRTHVERWVFARAETATGRSEYEKIAGEGLS